jgi:hypothetical protein
MLLLAVPRLSVTRPIRRGYDPVGRNAKCPCGSGKKFKQCHLPRPCRPAPDELDIETEIEDTEIETCTSVDGKAKAEPVAVG